MLLQAPTNHMYLSVSCLVVGQRGHLEQTASQHVLRRHFFDSPGAKAQLNKISQDLQRLTCNAAHRKNGNAMPRNGYISIWSQFSSFRFYCSVSHFIYIKLWARLRRREETRRGHRPTRPTSTNRRCHPTTAPHLEIFATKQQFPDQSFSLQR